MRELVDQLPLLMGKGDNMAVTMPFKAMQTISLPLTPSGKFNVPFKEGNVSNIDVWGDTKAQAISASGLQNLENCVNLLDYVDNTGHLLVPEGTKLFEFPNGNYACFEAMTSGYPGLGCLAYKMSNGNYIMGSQSSSCMSFGAAASIKDTGGCIYFFMVYDTTYNWYKIPGTVGVAISLNQYNNRWNLTFMPSSNVVSGANVNTWFGNSIAPDYTWTAWDQISGNNGQYRCNLTKIKDNSIGDFTGEVSGDSSDFDRISTQSDIWGDFQNMTFGSEKILAWSGNAYMTFKITAESQMPNYANFIFNFYSNQDSLLLTYTELVKWNGVDNSIAFYLSFVYDNENQAALFAPVIKMSDNSTYKWGYNNSYDESDMLYLWQWLQMSGAGEDQRPYDTGTTDDGGQPTGDILPNDDMPSVVVPTISAMQTGLFTVYCPSDADLSNIAAYLWSDNVIDNFKKYFNNFSDNLIALYVLPYKPTNLPTKRFTVGGLESETIASIEYVTQRFVTIDMGEINVGDVWDSYLDFAPYTRFNIYLPGIGVQALDADDIMAPLDKNKNFGAKLGSKITLEYALDLMTGICVAYIKINGQIRYQFSGKLGYQIPLTGENYSSILHAFSVASTGLVSTLATGGAAAPFAATSAVTAITNAMKPDVYRGGNLSGNAASLSYPTPYLIRRIPNKPELVNQDKFTGFQSYKSGKLRDFGGYTEVVEIHAEGFVCTEEERSEIIELLKKGVIL